MEQVLKQRDIILVPFPYPDQTGSKQRPALVLSSDIFNNSSRDIIICSMTSYNSGDSNLISIMKEDWEGGLWAESYVNPAYLTTIEPSLVIKRIGRLGKGKFKVVMQKFLGIFSG
ncbi:type II toxin-antitoxin system PemK/MazF family toxin [Candidatus Parvarchaeota archaeon]|nr:type II toxin-antitoxin system PemK/MazF family toxin [Candidatus Parvarchaeota archaeon]